MRIILKSLHILKVCQCDNMSHAKVDMSQFGESNGVRGKGGV